MTVEEWKIVNEAARVLVVPIGTFLSGVTAFIAVQVQRVLGQLRMMNGRLKEVEDWQEGHEVVDKERFEALKRELTIQERRCVEHLRK